MVRIPAELRDRIDQQRGKVPREAFVRDLLEVGLQALDDVRRAVSGPIPGQTSIDVHLPPAERRAQRGAVAASREARAAVKPIPKGGKG